MTSRPMTILEEIENEQIQRQTRVYDAVKPLMEPASQDAFIDQMPHLSMAISLKRIADAICGGSSSAGIADAISQAISEGIYNATRR